MSVNISCKTGESSVACAAALHVACVDPEHRLGPDADPWRACAKTSRRSRSPTSQSHAEALDRPGLGVEVDEDRVQRHRVALPARYVA